MKTIKLTKELKKRLVDEAIHARKWAYAPYSNYAVGAAVLASSGKIYTGVNVENAAYPATICAERAAIFKAITDGERQFDAVVVATENGGTPCGSCRQVMAEFGLETLVIMADLEGKVLQEMKLKDLLPGAFVPDKLNNGRK